MARPHLKISVPKPCSENWNAMSPQAQGRFCESCATTVVDFNSFTDEQLKAYFIQKSGKTCGRFSHSQLNNPIFLGESPKPNFFVKALASLALLSGLASQVQAQSNSENQVPTQQLIERIRGNKPKMVAKQPEKVSGDSLVISGKVIDKSVNEPLPFVPVMIKGTSFTAISLVDGSFKLSVPADLLPDTIIIQTKYIGYDTNEVLVDRNKILSQYNIFLAGALKGLAEIIVVNEGSGNFFQKTWWKTKNLFREKECVLPEE